MKKVTQSLLALLFAALPVTGFAAAADVLFSQKNASNTAWANVIVAPTASSALAFNSSKVPISTQALTLSSVTSPAGNSLTLGLGTGGTALTLASSTLAATFAGAVTVTPPNGTDGLRVISAGDQSNLYLETTAAGATKNWLITNNFNSAGNLEIRQSNSTGGDPRNAGTSRFVISPTGDVSISSTTAASSGVGALIVQGGISAGNTGAASYFGGAVNAGPVPVDTYALKAIGNTASGQSYGLNIDAGTTTADYSLRIRTATGGNADYFSVRGDGRVTVGSVSSPVATITSAGAATFTDSLIVSGTSPVVLRATGTTDIAVSAISTLADSSAFLYVQNDARQWTMRVNGADSDKFNIRDSTAGADRLTIDSAGAATFSGAVTAGGKLASTVASGAFGVQVESGARIALDGGSNTYIEESSADVIAFVTGGSSRLTLSTTTATFAGDLSLVGNEKYLTLNSDNTVGANGRARFRAVGSGGGSGYGGSFVLDTRTSSNNYVTALSIDSSQAATFAGAVTSTGTLTTSSGRVVATSIKTTTYTLATTDHVIVCNHASTPFTVTLIAASANTGRVFVVKNKGAATVTLSATSLGTIDGSNTRDLSTNQSLTLCSDGVQWNII